MLVHVLCVSLVVHVCMVVYVCPWSPPHPPLPQAPLQQLNNTLTDVGTYADNDTAPPDDTIEGLQVDLGYLRFIEE